MRKNFIDDIPHIPVIAKKDFDKIAEGFLLKYYPQALREPIVVPIKEIAKNKLGLKVITKFRLTEDFSILGQMCCNSGLTTIYDKKEDEYRDIRVRRGTMFIDPDVILLRNEGCFNNTIAHECVHWVEHRQYYIYMQAKKDTAKRNFKCPTDNKDEGLKEVWTDEDWMEWQANGIAPRILMPKKTFKIAVDKICYDGKHEYGDNLKTWWIEYRLAKLFCVSRQSVQIRLLELGIWL